MFLAGKRYAAGLLLGVCLAVALCDAQDLAPRAYVVTPVHWNAVIVTYDFSQGGLQFDNAVPISDTNAKLNAPILSYYHSLSFFGRSAIWTSLDCDFWFGGRTTVNGIQNLNTYQKNSRIGATVSVPLKRHQSIKISYNNGAYVLYGGNYHSVSVAWQYFWLGRPN